MKNHQKSYVDRQIILILCHIETSKTAKEKFRNVVELTMEMDKIIVNLPVKSDNVKKVIYYEPVISGKKLCDITKIKEGTIKNIINCLLEKNIIEITGYSGNQVLAFQKYIDLKKKIKIIKRKILKNRFTKIYSEE